jgi:hypothetical protein
MEKCKNWLNVSGTISVSDKADGSGFFVWTGRDEKLHYEMQVSIDRRAPSEEEVRAINAARVRGPGSRIEA